jgi:hypothetical protein
MISLDSIEASLHSIKVSDGTNDLLIDGSGYITANINGSVTVTATDLDIRDLSHLQDSVKIGDGVEFLEIDASGFITANINGTVTVTATDLDIRDLTSASDSVEIKTAAGQALDIDASGFVTANINGSVVVTATDLDIRDLSHTQDSIKVGDGVEFMAVNADGSINVNTVIDAISTWKSTAQTVTTTAGELAATPLASRINMIIQNLGSQDIYVGPSNAVTISTGTKIPKGSSMERSWAADADVWALTESSTSDVRISEYAA